MLAKLNQIDDHIIAFLCGAFLGVLSARSTGKRTKRKVNMANAAAIFTATLCVYRNSPILFFTLWIEGLAMFPVSNNLYEPLQGFYSSPMYLRITDDYGNETITVWTICELRNSEVH